ncbi:hypothetical protein AALM99_04345 [Lactococcus muris]|uniref:Uncharacterized protein n=1 Tax=Lactococcus muris TaxID=2941330 RepID=A0ABV4D9N9_9LACT
MKSLLFDVIIQARVFSATSSKTENFVVTNPKFDDLLFLVTPTTPNSFPNHLAKL